MKQIGQGQGYKIFRDRLGRVVYQWDDAKPKLRIVK